MEWLTGWTLWLIGGFALLILEAIIPGVFVMWWGLAALVVAIITALVPTLPLGWQATLFAILACLFSLLWWRYQHRKDQQEDRTSVLNQRDHAMLGTTGVIVELLENGLARGKFGDTTWRIEAQAHQSLTIGAKVQVIAVDGITLKVEQIA